MTNDTISITIKNNATSRVDTLIKKDFPHLSNTEIETICSLGLVQKDDRILKKGNRVDTNINIFLTNSQKNASLYKNKDVKLDIVYEDEHIIFVNKSSSVQTVSNSFLDTNTLSNYMAGYMNTIDKGGILNAGSINRLDNDTSGLVLFAKTDEAYDYLYNIYHKKGGKDVEKYYIATVIDRNKQFVNHIYMNDSIEKSNDKKMCISNYGDYAFSEASMLGHNDVYATLFIRLYTGLRHQLRLQLASRGFAIVGDSLYGEENIENDDRLMLHCYSMAISHPISKKKMIICCEPCF